MEPQYEIIILGCIPAETLEFLDWHFSSLLEDFDLNYKEEVRLITADTFGERRPEAASCVLYFGGDITRDLAQVEKLRSYLVPIIPVITSEQRVRHDLPASLCDLNVFSHNLAADNLNDLTAAAFENLGLLREQRQVFISYRRTESALAAMQLHDELSHRGFDVFLDTHKIRPGKVFQEVLWNRLCDSDVLIMLDTPTYFESKWTTEELARARAKEIKVLRVVWPSSSGARDLNFSEDVFLEKSDMSKTGRLTSPAIENIALKLEDVRSRSIAARLISIAGKFKAAMSTIGAEVIGVGQHRAINVKLTSGKIITAYPAVGVPSAETLNMVETRFKSLTGTSVRPFLVYDHTGIGNEWTKHLSWLDGYISNVELVDVSRAAWEVTGRVTS